jgi:hypothetical protein
MARYEFIGRPPKSFAIVFVLAYISFCVSWTLGAFPGFFARERSGGAFAYPIRFRGGQIWYYAPAVGIYLDWSLVGHCLALGLLALIWYRHRDNLLKRSPTRGGDHKESALSGKNHSTGA